MTSNKKSSQRLWRPDFRDVQALPDTKVIRTGFLINFIAISLALGFLTLYGMREYSLQMLTKSVKELETEVAESTSRNRTILDTNKRFRQSAQVVGEAVAFDAQPLSFHTFVAEVSGALQEGMILSVIELKYSNQTVAAKEMPPFVVELQGKVLADSPLKPAQVMNEFQNAVGELPSLEGKSIEMEIARFNRNNQAGDFDFTLLVKIAVERAPSL